MQGDFEELSEQRHSHKCWYALLGSIVLFHIVMMGIVVATLTQIAPEVQRTLTDVNIILPEMRRSLLDLGQMLPEIKKGMSILQKLCTDSPNCS
jgi:predicted PurR-regulated permease PerM